MATFRNAEPVSEATLFALPSLADGSLRTVLEALACETPAVTADFTTGDFSVHYVEELLDGARWECRWDRHPNSHNTRVHVHQPPTSDEVTDLSLPSLHPLDVYSTVLAAVETRIEELWSV
ncbi:hypothetical protein QA600_11365 [Natronococcus sp. A-GB1]|uniref:hypothetical protein n=1 Tax=Natronococcus sp. A-GB1 TaxID=3037648 RepID=UPI00241FC10F|nr:hypothetical protein [Natronococcus sp. A-GB1]MDG5759938.1 hypothetical protein [Natronococcus sp. A-GB1]